MNEDDDKALSWDEVSDPTYVAAPAVEPATRVEPAAVIEPASRVEPATSKTTSSFVLVSYGILGGVVLLYTIGWVLGIRQVVFASNDTLSGIAGFVSQVLAVAAPAIWFGGGFLLTRNAKPMVRLLVLLLGLVAALPLPFVLLGASQ
jgi:hypothetical protein